MRPASKPVDLQALFELPVNLLLFAGAFGLMLFYSVPLTFAAALLALLPMAASLAAGDRLALALVDKLAAALAENTRQPGRAVPAGLKEGLTLENVGFAYTPGEPALQGDQLPL